MIDRATRDVLAEKLRYLVSGRITNDEFEDAVHPLARSADRAINAVIDAAWFLYDDMRTYRLRGKKDGLPRETKHEIARVIAFLYSDFEYLWLTPLRLWSWFPRTVLYALMIAVAIEIMFFSPVVACAVAAIPVAHETRRFLKAFRSRRRPPLIATSRGVLVREEDLDTRVWPFAERDDYEAARRRPRLLAGGGGSTAAA